MSNEFVCSNFPEITSKFVKLNRNNVENFCNFSVHNITDIVDYLETLLDAKIQFFLCHSVTKSE